MCMQYLSKLSMRNIIINLLWYRVVKVGCAPNRKTLSTEMQNHITVLHFRHAHVWNQSLHMLRFSGFGSFMRFEIEDREWLKSCGFHLYVNFASFTSATINGGSQ